MSVIRKKPEINKIIEALNDTEKAKLAAELDNEAPLYTKSLINKNYYFSPLSNNTYEIAGILLEIAPTNTVPGIVIRTNNANNLREFFIQISYKQKLIMWRLNTVNRTIKPIDEDLDINELRRLLEEVHDHIVASEIDSGEEPANKVLVSDGDGGAEWANAMDTITPETVEEGDAVQLFGFNAQGQLVKDAIPEGITVDQSIIEDSENAVAGGAVYDLKEDVDALETEMEEKANVNGNYPTMTVGFADNLTPYDESAGDDQDEPFSLQATGTGNGTQPDFSTGSGALMKEKQGNTVVVNQLVQNPNFESTSGWYSASAVTSFTVSNNVATIVAGGNTDNTFIRREGINVISGHTYLVYFKVKLSEYVAGSWAFASITGTQGFYVDKTLTDANEKLVFSLEIPNSSVSNAYFNVGVRNTNASNITYTLKDVYCIDLTQWFNGDIPQDILDHPDHFFRYYQGSLAYNVGELVNADGRYIKCIGMNQFDGTNDVKAIPNATYYINGSATLTYKDREGNIISNESKSNQTFVVPSNCLSIGVSGSGDISINLYYEDEPRCLTYEPYQVLTNNDTGNEVLRKSLDKKDVKLPSGIITHNVYEYAFTGSETWAFYDTGDVSSSFWYIDLGVDTPRAETNKSVLTSNGIVVVCQGGNHLFRIMLKDNPSISSSTNINSIFSNGTKMIYDLLEPTTEQGTQYSENLVIDDFGSMDFGSDVPQGALIFYPVDYKAFVDTLYKYSDGTPSNIALKSDVTTEQSARESVDTQLLNAVGGTLRQCLCVKESLDFDNTAVVDLGELTWTYSSTSATGTFIAPIVASSNANKRLCTKYKIVGLTDYTNMEDKTIQVRADYVYVRDTAYAEATAFKNAMKGVLLAYEKASE